MTVFSDRFRSIFQPGSALRGMLGVFLFFLAIRAALAVWTWGVRQIFPESFPVDVTSLYKGVSQQTNPWLEPWQRWDTPQYQAIAERGYRAFDTAFFTPPLFPSLMRWAAPLFGGNTLVSGLLVSGLAFLGSMLAIYRLTCFEFRDEATAMRAVTYLAFFPSAFFLAAAYSESLFLLAAILCLYFTRQEKWIPAGLCGGLAALARIPGILLMLVIGYAAWTAWRKGNRCGWVALAAMSLIISAWYLYMWIAFHEPPTTVLTAQNLRGGYLTIPGLNLVEAARRIFTGQLVAENTIELGFSLVFIVFTILIWKKIPRLYGIYAAALMLFFLMRMGSPQPLVSMVRYVLEIFPAFLLYAQWGNDPAVNRLILILSWFGLLYFSAQFAIWGWVG